MTMKIFLAMALSVTATLSMANDITIPAEVLERHSKECPDFADAERGEYLLREAHQLPGDKYSPKGPMLYLLGCETYAYNSREKAYLVDSFSVTSVAVTEILPSGALSATTDLMGSSFDLATLTLGTFQKGRGMADCGSAYTYKFDTLEQKFILTEARVKEECDGEDTDWPVIYKR